MIVSKKPPVGSSKRRLSMLRSALLLRPSAVLTPDRWAELNRTYPPSAGKPGPRDPGLTPYMVPFANALAERRYRRVVSVNSAQSGKTDNVLDVIGWRLDHSPAPILYVGPSKQFVTEQFEPRVMALLDEAPVLSQKVARGKRMTKTRKMVAGVPLRLAYGGSSAALKSDPAALAIIDEYDEMLANVKGQGAPLTLIEARGATYADFVCGVVSTPGTGVAGIEHDEHSGLDFWEATADADLESSIWKLWRQGTRHHFVWRCLHCGTPFIPRFRHLRWPQNASPAEARRKACVECPHCGGIHTDQDKATLNRAGAFVAPGQRLERDGSVSGTPPEVSTLSFWTSGLCSPFVGFGELAEAFLEAVKSGDQERIQGVINQGFGELWAPGGGEVPELAAVARLRMPYLSGDVPDGVRVLTAGVDVQKNRLVYVIRGWGARGTSWLIKHGELWGPTDEPAVWETLDDLLEQRICGFAIRLTLIDSGFRPNKVVRGPEHVVYEFCRRHQRNCLPSKGYDTLRAPVIMSKIEVNAEGRAAKYGLNLVRVNADWCKLWIHERIRWPQDQTGAFHLPEDASDDYCAQLVSEARVRKPSGRATWIQRSRANHYLDCEALAYAAGYLLNVQHIADGAGGRRQLATASTDPPDDHHRVPTAIAANRTNAAPRVAYSRYMMRHREGAQ